MREEQKVVSLETKSTALERLKTEAESRMDKIILKDKKKKNLKGFCSAIQVILNSSFT